MAWRAKRVFGYAVRSDDREADNTTTAFKFEDLCRIDYRAADKIDKPDSPSRLFFAVSAFSPNCLPAYPVPILMGGPVCGVASANYSGSRRVILDFWEPVSMADWELISPTTRFTDSVIEYDDWAIGRPLALSGKHFALGEPGENPIDGARVSPPELDPFVFIRERTVRIDEEDVYPSRIFLFPT